MTERTILVVEDDESLRRIVGRQLRARRFDVTEAASAEEATAQLSAGLRPAVVLLDLNLPGDTGWDLLRSEMWRRAGSPPVLVASATTVDPRRLDEFQCAGYLPKPFPMETLVDTLERFSREIETSHDGSVHRRDRRPVRAGLGRLLLVVRPSASMNVLEFVTAAAALLVFLYLLWAMLRPEDF